MNENGENSTRIGVVGAGSWGTALASLLAEKNHSVDLWAYEEEVCQQIRTQRENTVFLPGIRLPPNLSAHSEMEPVVSGKELILLVVPSHVYRQTVQRMTRLLSAETVLVTASKGIENGTHLTMSRVLRDIFPECPESRIAVLSGPSFAKEVAARVPTAVTVASSEPDTAIRVQKVFATPYFRVYTSDDLVGVELGGAVKNVVAIAAGIIDGLGLGLNTRAALITRGLTELRRLGLHLGANPRTFTGLAGLGDLILTCTGTLSRNHTVGFQIGQGMTLKDILSRMRMVAEGVETARSVYDLSRKVQVEMPICWAVYQILYEEMPPSEALHRLMTRDLKQELDEY